eukprot:gene3255-3533_t
MSTRIIQNLQEVIQLECETHTTITQAATCLQKYGGLQQLTAPGLADTPSLGKAVRSSGDNELLDKAICLSTPAEDAEDDVMLLEEEGSTAIAG